MPIPTMLTNPSAPAGKSERYARSERERRFLLAGLASGGIEKTAHIIDRYFLGTRLRLRQMIQTSGDSVTTFFKLTQKVPGPGGAPGLTLTTYLNKEEFALLARLPGSELRKTRYSIPPFGVDAFESALRGLFRAEVEFDDDEAMYAFSPPPWIIGEVTRDSRFTGGSLATLDSADLKAALSLFGHHPDAQ